MLQFLPHHVRATVGGIRNMYGADFIHISQNSLFGPQLGGLPLSVGVALAALHFVGLALAVWGFFRAFRYFFDPADLVSPVLATGIVVNVAAYVPSVVSARIWDAREIVAVLPFGAVLAGRMVPPRWPGCRGGSSRHWHSWGWASLPAIWPVLASGPPSRRRRTTSRRSFPGWRHTTSPAGWASTPRRTSS